MGQIIITMKICNELLWIHIQLGILSNWGYTHTGGKLSDSGHVVPSWHPSALDVITTADTHTSGGTLKLGICSRWGQTVKWQSGGKVLVSLYNICEYICGYTHNWRYPDTEDTLTLETNCQTAFMQRRHSIYLLQTWV